MYQFNEYLSFEAGADLERGDIVKLNSDNEVEKVAAAEATNAVGICYNNADEGDKVTVLVRGVMDDVHLLVEDTDSSSGYDDPIAHGDLLVISGKASGTYVAGQALSTTAGSGVSTADATTIIGRSLTAVAGVDSGDTYTTGKVFVNFV